MEKTQILQLSAVELGRAIREGRTTAVEATEAVLEQIEKTEEQYNCYITVARERVDDHRIRLALPPEAGVGLLVQFQRPGQPKPDQCGASGLEVEAMSGRGRVDEGHRQFPTVPPGDCSPWGILHTWST